MINNLKLYHLMCVQSCGLQIDKQMAITNVNSNFYTYFFYCHGTSRDMALSLLLAFKWVGVCEEIQC